MSKIEVKQIPVLNDNYVYLLRDEASGKVGVVDPAVAAPILEAADHLGWKITHILNTHHHHDHVGGNAEIQAATGAIVVGAKRDRERIPGIAVEVDEGDSFHLGEAEAKVFFIPGHTTGHIAYWFAESNALFCGDTIFALGCGRIFEGNPEMMWDSLAKLRELPDETAVYCAHEYTQANARFAVTAEPDNAALKARAQEIDTLRAKGLPTVPSLLGEEKRTNPFLRADEPSLAAHMGLSASDPVAVFAEVRQRKDSF